MEEMDKKKVIKAIQGDGFSGNGFSGNGSNGSDNKFELTGEELKELIKDFI